MIHRRKRSSDVETRQLQANSISIPPRTARPQILIASCNIPLLRLAVPATRDRHESFTLCLGFGLAVIIQSRPRINRRRYQQADYFTRALSLEQQLPRRILFWIKWSSGSCGTIDRFPGLSRPSLRQIRVSPIFPSLLRLVDGHLPQCGGQMPCACQDFSSVPWL